MKCRNSAGALLRTLWLSLLVLAFGSVVTPPASADLVEEVEDLDRQQRPEPTPTAIDLPAVAPTSPQGAPRTPAPKPQAHGKRQKPAKRAPVQFESKSLQAMKDQSRVILKEDVLITQGDFRLQADEATIYFDQKTREAMKVIASGRVKAFKSDVELKQRVKAECNEAVFYNQERKMVLRGNAKLWRGEDLVRGKQITYELDTGWIKAERVEGVVQPGGKK